MGCRASKNAENDAPNRVDDSINQELRKAKKAQDQVLKLLLLGAGSSGKSTIFKQMQILYGEGYSEEKRAALRGAVHNNLVSGAQAIIRAANEGVAGRPLEGESRAIAEKVLEVEENVELSEETAHAIAKLYQDPNFAAAWDDRSNFQVLDGWADFAKQCHKFPEWGGPSWIPSIADAIRARVRTSGIVEEQFDIDGFNFVLIDVGGQRNERRKWIHCFQQVTAVIFVAAISEYDQMLFEARDKNRLEEALELFDSICNSEWFERTNLVLFLNKSDIFRYKLCERRIPINKSGLFPDAPSGFDYQQGADWMRRKFLAQKKNPRKVIFTHVTCATDTYGVQVVFDACKDSILRDSLQNLGLMPT
ncbi:Guanine nucleotide-binding protein subunit alpha [Hondaea fermentalgiana]|uniref:Guanine nucleotide-binding protein subunit alpha n=1 Tax=Hondaea fermentalgiana TaxID=2315210 RepID=A0A2R5GVN4_9STRA|nr:Guanine nucleotide-binding protein subunit alpha [Hondaea fermentalgiana]|eukprot:GBG34906.1 Guanine nucleotide-binding protein subunit alpha [Hondaea fermentalgiana]